MLSLSSNYNDVLTALQQYMFQYKTTPPDLAHLGPVVLQTGDKIVASPYNAIVMMPTDTKTILLAYNKADGSPVPELMRNKLLAAYTQSKISIDNDSGYYEFCTRST